MSPFTKINPIIWAVTDGRAGYIAQALGLANKIAELIKGTVIEKTVSIPSYTTFPPLAPLSKKFIPELIKDIPENDKPDMVIGCGNKSQPAVLHVKNKYNTFVIYIQRPQFRQKRYDAIVAPYHNYTAGKINAITDNPHSNIILTFGSVGLINPTTLRQRRETAEQQFRRYATPRIAVLIGGNNRAYRIHTGQLIKQLNDIVAKSKGTLLITPSRRTSAECHTTLIKTFSDSPHYVWDGNTPNPYMDILAIADAVCVTMDSVNMISEACTCQQTVYIIPLPKKPYARHAIKKFSNFHRQIYERGNARPWTGEWAFFSSELMDETTRAARMILQIINYS